MAPKPYKIIGFGDLHDPKPYKIVGFGDLHDPKPHREHQQQTLPPDAFKGRWGRIGRGGMAQGFRPHRGPQEVLGHPEEEGGPLLPQNPLEKVGGEAPHLFQ